MIKGLAALVGLVVGVGIYIAFWLGILGMAIFGLSYLFT